MHLPKVCCAGHTTNVHHEHMTRNSSCTAAATGIGSNPCTAGLHRQPSPKVIARALPNGCRCAICEAAPSVGAAQGSPPQVGAHQWCIRLRIGTGMATDSGFEHLRDATGLVACTLQRGHHYTTTTNSGSCTTHRRQVHTGLRGNALAAKYIAARRLLHPAIPGRKGSGALAVGAKRKRPHHCFCHSRSPLPRAMATAIHKLTTLCLPLPLRAHWVLQEMGVVLPPPMECRLASSANIDTPSCGRRAAKGQCRTESMATLSTPTLTTHSPQTTSPHTSLEPPTPPLPPSNPPHRLHPCH